MLTFFWLLKPLFILLLFLLILLNYLSKQWNHLAMLVIFFKYFFRQWVGTLTELTLPISFLRGSLSYTACVQYLKTPISYLLGFVFLVKAKNSIMARRPKKQINAKFLKDTIRPHYRKHYSRNRTQLTPSNT